MLDIYTSLLTPNYETSRNMYQESRGITLPCDDKAIKLLHHSKVGQEINNLNPNEIDDRIKKIKLQMDKLCSINVDE